MNNIIKYTLVTKEIALTKMFQSGLTATDKSKIIRARKLPKNTFDNFDVFKTYFLSKEGLAGLFKKLSQEEIIVLHILAFNQWITDVRVFEAAYMAMPKPQKYYYYGRETFTQQYSPVLKAVQTSLVQKGLLIKYEESLGGNTKAERQRFLFPTEFADYLPSVFTELKTLKTDGKTTDENVRKDLQKAIQLSPKATLSGLALVNKKLMLRKELLTNEGLIDVQFRQWRLGDGALILSNQYFDEGKPMMDFVLHHLKHLKPNQWFSKKSVTTLLSVWDDPKKRRELDIDKKYPRRYHPEEWCEEGWKAGLLEKQTKAGMSFYRLVSASTETADFGKYLTVKADGSLWIDLATIPLSELMVLNQLATFQTKSTTTNMLQPDLVNMSSLPETVWAHPLVNWLKTNVPTFKNAFATYQRKFGKELIHSNLLVAKVTDLSIRVLVEKGLKKEDQLVVLSDEFIAFPKSALAQVERIITKSGNVIKHVTAK
ncbi:MAG: hypothetical protein AAGJ18_14340 [Bacteroidota bacterium]